MDRNNQVVAFRFESWN